VTCPPLARRTSFLEQIQGLIERTYGLDTGISDVGAFLVGDEGIRRLYGQGLRAGARLLVRCAPDGRLFVRLYYPDALVSHLERHHPLRELHSGNVDALVALVEELDHLLLLADRARRGAETSLLDMEVQANVTKALVLAQLVGRHLGRPLRFPEKSWARWHALEKGRYVDPDPEVARRYAEARRLARKILDHLDGMEPPARLAWLRRFARTPGPRRIREAERLAA